MYSNWNYLFFLVWIGRTDAAYECSLFVCISGNRGYGPMRNKIEHIEKQNSEEGFDKSECHFLIKRVWKLSNVDTRGTLQECPH